jgi:hypothetical protein
VRFPQQICQSGQAANDNIADVGSGIFSCHKGVMRSTFNPARRNRNIGTAKQGHGQDNSLVIPERSDGEYWLEHLSSFKIEERAIGEKNVSFIVEENALGCVHSCSISDVARILEAVPSSDWAGLRTFVFRQPTRKQLTLNPVWGRLLYNSELKSAKGQLVVKGPVIYLDAIVPNETIKWSTSLRPDEMQELERLQADGHIVSRKGTKHDITVTVASARNTQLYRTLLHEIGHWFDWLSKVEEPSHAGFDRDALELQYFARQKSEREAFAHRYADDLRIKLEVSGVIPLCEVD